MYKRQESYCKVTQCNTGYAKVGDACALSSAPITSVNLVVLRNNDGTGNEKWNLNYIYRMLDQLTNLTLGHVGFRLGQVTYIHNSKDYNNSKQDKIKMNYTQFRQFGSITAIVSQPHTTDSAGTAIGIKYNYEPIFVIRSRLNDGSAQDSYIAAAVFLHELGHNMGMKHNYCLLYTSPSPRD